MNRSNIKKQYDGVNDWGLTYNTDYNKSQIRIRNNAKTSFSVRLCNGCNTPYETTKNQYTNELTIHYYDHFYRRGLCEAPCPKCR